MEAKVSHFFTGGGHWVGLEDSAWHESLMGHQIIVFTFPGHRQCRTWKDLGDRTAEGKPAIVRLPS
jgi:hypothetical protein